MILEQEKSESSKLSYFPYFQFEGIQKKKKEGRKKREKIKYLTQKKGSNLWLGEWREELEDGGQKG